MHRFICAVACERLGFRAPDLDDLVNWSLIIDGAQYPDARTAVELGAPAMKLTLVIEAAKGSDIVQKIIGWMQRRQLSEIIAEPEIRRSTSRSTSATWNQSTSSRTARAQTTAWCSSTWPGYDMEGYNKFIPYYLFPDCYTVSVSPRVSARRFRWGRIRGRRRSRSITWRPSASATAAAATRAWEPSAWSRGSWNKRGNRGGDCGEELKT